jgi:hypothetical protein
VAGSTVSFVSLVRKYAGDVPHHAVLEELRRLKLIKEDGKRLQLITSAAPTSRALEKSLSLLLALVADAAALPSEGSGRAAKGFHRITLDAADARDSIALYERALTSAAAFASGLDQSLRLTRAHKSKQRGSQVTVSVLVRLQERGTRRDSKTRRQRNVPKG